VRSRFEGKKTYGVEGDTQVCPDPDQREKNTPERGKKNQIGSKKHRKKEMLRLGPTTRKPTARGRGERTSKNTAWWRG